MKKLTALVLVIVMLAALLAGCTSAPNAGTINPNVRLTSSDGADAAAWLTARLGEVPDRVVVGTNADGYGVDVAALEDDGYIIRDLGGEVALFAKTASGLDRAVRRYAKAVESGEAVEDTTYHEGYRVKSLTIAGNDISDYAIVRVTVDDPCVTTAADEFAAYIKAACGAVLPVCAEADFAATGKAHKIAISSGDETLGDEGYTITVDEAGDLAIDGGVWRGSYYGTLDLLEDIGWRFIGFGSYSSNCIPLDRQSYLYEAESVDLTAEINRTEIPSIPIRGGVGGLKQRNTYSTQSSNTQQSAPYGGYGFAVRVCHGLQNNHKTIFSGEYEGLYEGGDGPLGFTCQPCFTNEDILEAIDHYALASVQKRLDAGQKIGREIVMVDVSQWDGGSWTFCTCKSCLKLIKSVEGYHTGALLRMANRVAALLDEYYPGVSAGILAYAGTDHLPRVTRPAHNVIVSFCYYVSDFYLASCQNHCISGEDCDVTTGYVITNRPAAAMLEEWLEVTDPKMMQIWYYPFITGNKCYNSPLYGILLKDAKYFAERHIEHIYFCMDRHALNNSGLLLEVLTEYLGAKYMWDADMTEEEGLAVMREWFEIVCGEDAGGELFELAMFAERAGDQAGCWSSYWGLYRDIDSSERVRYSYVAEHADEVWAKCLRAASLADDAAGEAFAEKYATGFMFMIVRATYDDMYVNGTDAERELVTERYREMWSRMANYGIYSFNETVTAEFDPDVDPRAWIG